MADRTFKEDRRCGARTASHVLEVWVKLYSKDSTCCGRDKEKDDYADKKEVVRASLYCLY